MTEVFGPVRIEVMTLGEAWIAIASAILTSGVVGSWEGLPIVEVFRATLDVNSPRVEDPIIAQHGDPERVAWMHANFDRLAANPWARDATVTTFQPLTDTGYIPCVSLLDLWLVEGKLQLAVYAHAIDFGTKGYANLIELAALQTGVASDLSVGVGTLTMTVKSAHIYQTELGPMRGIIAAIQG